MKLSDFFDYISHYDNYDDLEYKYFELLKENIKLKEEKENVFDFWFYFAFILGVFSGMILIMPFFRG